MLIASLPQVHEENLLGEIISHPLVAAVRYNTGMDSAFSPKETLDLILKRSLKVKKPLYVDLKGRQLRVAEWAVPPFGAILLNHKIKVGGAAQVVFRGDDTCELKEIVDGNKIYVDPLPKFPVGKGQAINILAKSLEIEKNFTENDYEYIKAAVACGVNRFMLSFAESADYIKKFEEAANSYGLKKLELILKIESQAGVDFVRKSSKRLFEKYPIMAARDDLMVQIGGLKMMDALKTIIKKDRNAICASRIFLGLEHGTVTLADIEDIELMRILGYERFMLSDGISRKYFKEAINFWEKYMAAR